MRNLRRHLEPTYAEYPAKTLWRIFGRKISKFILWIVCSALWFGAMCIGASVINLKEKDASGEERELTILQKVTSQGGSATFIIGSVVMLIIIARSGMGGQYIPVKKAEENKQKRPDK